MIPTDTLDNLGFLKVVGVYSHGEYFPFPESIKECTYWYISTDKNISEGLVHKVDNQHSLEYAAMLGLLFRTKEEALKKFWQMVNESMKKEIRNKE